MVKAPAWWFQQKQMLLKSLPPPVASTVALHVRGSVELGLVQESTVLADSLGSECRLTFDSEIGLSLSHAAPVSPQPDDYDDESYD
jgi:hypothetical protein